MSLSVLAWILRKPSQSSFLIKLVQSESTIRNGMNQVLRAPRLQTSLRQLNTSFRYCSSVLLKIYHNVLTFLLAANTDVHRDKPPPFLRETYVPSRKHRMCDRIYISRLWCFALFADRFSETITSVLGSVSYEAVYFWVFLWLAKSLENDHFLSTLKSFLYNWTVTFNCLAGNPTGLLEESKLPQTFPSFSPMFSFNAWLFYTLL